MGGRDTLEAVTLGIADDRLSEMLVAVLRFRDAANNEPDALIAYLSENLAAYKIPKDFLIVTEPLPRNASGKVPKPEVRKLYLALRDGG